jgi:hypothetical protein
MGYDPDDKAKVQEMQKSAGPSYGISFVASLVTAFVLAKIIDVTSVTTVLYGMKVGFAVWLGFVATVQLTEVLFAKKPVKLYLINTGYQHSTAKFLNVPSCFRVIWITRNKLYFCRISMEEYIVSSSYLLA